MTDQNDLQLTEMPRDGKSEGTEKMRPERAVFSGALVALNAEPGRFRDRRNVTVSSDSYQLLIADDDAGFRETLRRVFEPFFELIEAESGEEAVALVEYRPIHIALLDMHMHLMTGLETLRRLKQANETAPCILITSDATEQLRQDGGQANAYSVLKKPVSRRDLVHTVCTAIEQTYEDPDARIALFR